RAVRVAGVRLWRSAWGMEVARGYGARLVRPPGLRPRPAPSAPARPPLRGRRPPGHPPPSRTSTKQAAVAPRRPPAAPRDATRAHTLGLAIAIPSVLHPTRMASFVRSAERDPRASAVGRLRGRWDSPAGAAAG